MLTRFPDTLYLRNDLIAGIRKIFSKKIVDYFEADNFHILSTKSARFLGLRELGNSVRQKSKKPEIPDLPDRTL
jgi:hypothetical protein